ncbi:hypothetical protein CEXT_54461 [Caerostris extrusa]|uniref:Uncharacterized protein n=1 Tax=Caerostris extrusa TaxID=172846 RepID=A0AAV4QMU3_CAEEX|nr:hypothetical protein CEXT_54461 [Caerostris extrusa]
MSICTGNSRLEKIIEEKALVLWGKIFRTSRYLTLWNLESPSQHCLKRLKLPARGVETRACKDSYNLNFEVENCHPPQSFRLSNF